MNQPPLFAAVGRLWLTVVQHRCAPAWRAAGQALLAVVLGLVLAQQLPLAGWLTGWQDAQLARWAPPAPADAALVVDIDEPSLQRLGAWPLPRSTYLPVADWLQAAGARALAFNMLLADGRDDDAAVDAWLRRSSLPVVMAARALGEGGALQPALALPPGCAAWPVSGWQLPLWARRSAADDQPPALPIQRVGAHSLPIDPDGTLRRWPLWQQAGELALPVLPLAAWQAVNPQAAAVLACAPAAAAAQAGLGLGDRGTVQPMLARPATQAAAVPLALLVDAAAGRLGDAQVAQLAARVRGRVVFIGSSAVQGDQVLTPLGVLPATPTLAAAYDALSHGQMLRPARQGTDLALLAVALLPLLAGLRRPSPRPLAELAWIAAAVALVLLFSESLVAGAATASHLAPPLAVLAVWAAAVLLMAACRVRDERQRLQAARARAELAGRIKDDVLAHVGHEIRTPLNALLGAADLLAGTRLDSSQARHVGLFRGAGQELMQMLNDLLDLSKIEAGLLTVERRPFSLSRLVAAQVMLFEARAQQKGLQLRVEVLPDLPEVVLGDRLRLAQVLRNLLSNAVKFTSVGSVTLAVGRAGDGQQIRFEVRDTGIGVPGDRAEAIFAPYTQAAADTSQRYGGTGLGLTIARRLVQAMGGRIGLSSREGLGSNFHIELPLPVTAAPAQDPPGPDPLLLAADLAPDPTAAPALRLRLPAWPVLLVDDSPLNVMLAQAYLEGTGVRVDVVHDGAAAVRRFEAERHPVVLMDLQMPVLDGLEAARQMRAIEQRRPRAAPALLVALTGRTDDHHVDDARGAGFDVHLGKPVPRQQLLAVLAQHASARGEAQSSGSGHSGNSAGDTPTSPASSSGVATTVSGLPAPAPAARSPRLKALSQLPDSDPATALERLGGAAMYDRVLDAAGQAMQQFSPKLVQALDAVPCDLPRAQRLAHDLKSLAATLGLNGLAADAQALEMVLDATVAPTSDPAVVAARAGVAARLQALHSVLAPGQPPEATA
jgi:signal transduction histidine kinase/CheY-like chemotaxis protein/HPt (histidine-containing phosphotransfer) domain-containing protein